MSLSSQARLPPTQAPRGSTLTPMAPWHTQNHQYDFGLAGLNHTHHTLTGIGIPFGGVGTPASVREPVVLTSQGVQVAFFNLVVDECWVWPNGTLYLDGCTCGANADPSAHPPYQCYQANDTMPGLWYQASRVRGC